MSAFQGGAFEYLPKPFDVPKAVELIRRALDESLRESVLDERLAEVPEMLVVGGILRAVRQLRTEARLSQTRALEAVVVDLSAASDTLKATVAAMKASIQAVSRAGEVRIDAATYATEVEGLTVGIVAGELPEKTPAPAPIA